MSDAVTSDVQLPPLRGRLLVGGALVGLLAAGAAAALVLPFHHAATHVLIISQRDRMFQPAAAVLHPGDTLRIVNDDGVLRHHAYVKSPEFNFDSGDQEPGQVTDIVFPVPGTYQVLCGIHPKMHLEVVVERPSSPMASADTPPGPPKAAE